MPPPRKTTPRPPTRKPPAPKPPPAPKTPAPDLLSAAIDPTARGLQSAGIGAPVVGSVVFGSASETTDAAVLTDDDINALVASELTRRREDSSTPDQRDAVARNAMLLRELQGEPVDPEAPATREGEVIFECPKHAFLEIQVGPDHFAKFRRHRIKTSDPTEIAVLRSKKTSRRWGIFEATTASADGGDLFWSSDNTHWHSDAARLAHDIHHKSGERQGSIPDLWPA